VQRQLVLLCLLLLLLEWDLQVCRLRILLLHVLLRCI
jgi:hypothetical protein